MDWTFVVFLVVFLVIGGFALVSLFGGEKVGSVAIGPEEVEPRMSGVTLVVTRRPPTPEESTNIQLQVRMTMGVNGFPLTPRDALALAELIEAAARDAAR